MVLLADLILYLSQIPLCINVEQDETTRRTVAQNFSRCQTSSLLQIWIEFPFKTLNLKPCAGAYVYQNCESHNLTYYKVSYAKNVGQ